MTQESVKEPVSVRRLFQFAWPERRLIGLGFIFLLISSATLLAYPMLVKVIINEALGSASKAKINEACLIVFGVFIIQGVTSTLRYSCFSMAGERIVMRIRELLYRSILEQDIAFFDQNRTGELMSRLSADTSVLQNALSVNISMLVRNAASAIGGIGLLLYTSPRLTFVLLLALPFLGLGVAYFGRKVRDVSRRVQDELAKTATIAEETISGVRTVQAFAQVAAEERRYRAGLLLTLSATRGKIQSIAWFMGIASVFGYAAIVGVIWYGGMLLLDKSMDLGELMSFILYALTVGVSMATLGGLWTDFMAATGASRRIFELLDRVPQIPLELGIVPKDMQGRIRFQDLSFAYPSRPDVKVLDKLHLDIKPGEVLALVGPSGAGKSTIGSLIARFYDCDTGSVLIDEHDVRSLNVSALRRHIGLVSQDPVLISSSIAANIRYGKADASDEEVMRAAEFAHARAFIESFPDGMHTIIGERGVQLSGGQRQRIAIARAVLKDPRILILDEATSALDSESEYHVKEALDRLMKGRTTLVIAHRLSTVKDADRVLVLERGQIVQEGTHELLMSSKEALYYRLVERQFFQG